MMRKIVHLLVLLLATSGLLLTVGEQASAKPPPPSAGIGLKMSDHKPMTAAERLAAARRVAKARHAAGIKMRPNLKMIPPRLKSTQDSGYNMTPTESGVTNLFASFLMTAASALRTGLFPAPASPPAAPNAGGGILGQADYFGMYPNYANSPFPASVSIFGDGVGALATVTVNPDGTIGGFTVLDGGTGYTFADVSVIGGGGSGGFGIATIDPVTGAITAIAVDPANPGSGYGSVPGIRKFVDTLPGLTAAGANNLGQYLPVAIPDTTSYPGSDYYEISLVEFTEQMHSDLPPTTLRGYVQTNTTDPTVSKPNYLGPVIVAQRDRPVRIKFTNALPNGGYDPATGKRNGDLFIPVDTTDMGAGPGPMDANGQPCDWMNGGNCEMYTQNRATLHLHGGNTPWISDGTPHQWITPAGENTHYPQGVSVQNVPDMNMCGADNDGCMTFYYTNQQSARLMFYHDHAYGITRLNVYAGEAAGYLIQDQVEKGLVDSGILPSAEIPLVIQDKAFVPSPSQLAAEDPTWDTARYGGYGNLWFPHVYMTNQNPWDLSGANAMGRWDYAEWFWPPYTGLLMHGSIPNPLCLPTPPAPGATAQNPGVYDCSASPGEPPFIPGIQNPSLVPEAFVDTPVVNGTAYPVLNVDPKPYRFRILNAANDRFWNLSLYQAGTEVNGVFTPCSGDVWTGTTLNNGGCSGEVPMVPAVKGGVGTAGYTYPDQLDGRMGGVPDSRAAGPHFIQIGTEGGFLPAPVDLPNGPIGYNYNRRDIVVLNVSNKNLFLGPAERADVVVDFTQFAGKTLILYSDAPAPVPAFDPRNDYYTGNPDQTMMGGAPSTLPGYGPNTRTIMQIRVAATTPAPAFDLARLQNAFKSTASSTGVFAGAQNPVIVPESAYNSAYGATYTDALARIQDTQLSFTPQGQASPITIGFKPKAIQELFETNYGRMNATLGVELPFTNANNQTTVPLGYIDPYTEDITGSDSAIPIGAAGDGTQIWKITHNGVDTHAIHFHLYDVQVINRVGWDGAIRKPDPNELGWKDTVRMNPLEDIIVALRPFAPTLPFTLPLSSRPDDVTRPVGATWSTFDPLTGGAVNVVNQVINLGWEYVWHCHLLGHEENDMMRPVKFTPAVAQPDTTAPVVVALQSPAAPASGVYTTNVNLYFAATDNPGGSGVKSITYSASGGQTIASTETPGNYATLTLTQSGTTTVTYFATDNAGNSSAPQTLTFTLNTGPTVAASVSPAPNAAGWNNSDATVTLTATAYGGATISSITYSASGAQPIALTTVTTNPATILVNTEGTTVISYYATDSNGTTNASQTVTVKLDKSLPTVSATLSPLPNAAGWNNADTTVNIAATDVGPSGIASLTYSASGAQTIASTTVNGSSAAPVINTEGTTTLSFTATDVAGNVSAAGSITVKLDKTAPVASATVSPLPNGAGWNNTSPVTVNLSATDTGGSGLVDISYSATGATTIASTSLGTTGGSFPISAEGVTTVAYTATDGAGNIATGTIDVKIDTVAPTLTFGAATPAANAAGWNNTAVSIPWTASDATSGVATPGPSGSLSFTTEGANQTQTVTVVDVAGNSATFTSPAVSIDLTAPVASASASPLPNGAGWNNTSPVTVSLSATDTGGSGLADISYTIGGGTPVSLGTAGGSFPISAEGVSAINYTATDVAGNIATGTLNVKIDTVAPALTWGTPAPAPNAAGWNNTAVSIPWTATDATSGVATPGASGSLTISTEGANQTGTVTVTDNAGNSATFTSPAVNIDLTAPAATGSVSPTPNGAGWNNTSPVAVSLSATDGLSGVASITYSASGAQTIASTTVNGSSVPAFNITAQGVTTITYTATDNAGNVSAAQTLTVKIDTVAPTLTWGAQTPPPNGYGWNNTAVSIPWTAADATSGVATPGTSGTLSFTAQGANQTQKVTVTDNAGNSATFTSPAVNIDLTAPTITATCNPRSAPVGNRTVTVTISGNAADLLSGLVLTSGTYSISNGGGNGNFTVSSTGTYSFSVGLSTARARTYTITVRVRDRAGNRGTASCTFRVG